MSIKGLLPKRGKKSRFKQGYFDVSESTKYTGPKPCIYRSSWEWAFMRWCESSAIVETWSSEPFYIKYLDSKAKERKYYIDFVVKLSSGETWLIEVKPYKDTIPSNSKTYLKNRAKWKYAKEFADRNGFKFTLLTERSSIIKRFLR